MRSRKKTGRFKDLILLFRDNQQRILDGFYKYGLSLLILLVFQALLFYSSANNFNYDRLSFRVEKNMTAGDVLNKLNYYQLIRNRRNAKLAVYLAGWSRHIHTGKYKLSPSMSVKTIFETLGGKRGLSEDEDIRVVIPEGYSFLEIVDALSAAGITPKETMLEFLRNLNKEEWRAQYSFLAENNLDNQHFFEGYLFPDTYSFPLNTAPTLVVSTMLDNFQNKVVPILKNNKTNLNTHQLLTLASIVEKEAVKPEERELIAGVFTNRLKKYMYLGSCPTVKYAMGRPRQKYLLFKQLNYNSPYNTYRKIGLPPGPICSPGKAAILAAMHPQKTDYFYFVALGDGSHIFSRSLKEHLNYQKEILAEGKVY